MYLEPKWLRCFRYPVNTYPLHFIAPCRGELHRRFAGGSESPHNLLMKERKKEGEIEREREREKETEIEADKDMSTKK